VCAHKKAIAVGEYLQSQLALTLLLAAAVAVDEALPIMMPCQKRSN